MVRECPINFYAKKFSTTEFKIYTMLKIKIILNGEEKFLDHEMSVEQLIKKLDLDVKKIAVEKNLEIVSQDKFSQVMIEDGNHVEIVHFIGGG